MSGAGSAARDIMRSAGAEPTVGRASKATIVIGLTAPRTDPLIMTAIFGNLAEDSVCGIQAAAACQLPSKLRPYFQIAQAMRARRFARATVVTL